LNITTDRHCIVHLRHDRQVNDRQVIYLGDLFPCSSEIQVPNLDRSLSYNVASF
jgi:hypothetical protein